MARSQIEPKFRKKAIRIRSSSLNNMTSNSMNRKEAVLLVHASSLHQLERDRHEMFGWRVQPSPPKALPWEQGRESRETLNTELYSTLLASRCDPLICCNNYDIQNYSGGPGKKNMAIFICIVQIWDFPLHPSVRGFPSHKHHKCQEGRALLRFAWLQ